MFKSKARKRQELDDLKMSSATKFLRNYLPEEDVVYTTLKDVENAPDAGVAVRVHDDLDGTYFVVAWPTEDRWDSRIATYSTHPGIPVSTQPATTSFEPGESPLVFIVRTAIALLEDWPKTDFFLGSSKYRLEQAYEQILSAQDTGDTNLS